MAIKTKGSLSFELDEKFIDAVAERVMEKSGLIHDITFESLPFFTVKQVAQLTQKTNLTIYRHIDTDLLKAKKVGKSFIIQKEDLQEYLTSQNL